MNEQQNQQTVETDVVVVGGSLVGLTTSLLLAKYQVPHLVIERHSGTAIHPRAASFHQRTMEVFRHAGIQNTIEAAAAREFVQNGAILAVENLCGKELNYFYKHWNDGVEDLSATTRLLITQVGLEPLLRDSAKQLGAKHYFNTQMLSFKQSSDGVKVHVQHRDTKQEQTISARYLVAADGAHSLVREQLNIAMQGHGSSDCVTVYFDAPMKEMIGNRNLSVTYVLNARMLGFFRFAFDQQSGFLSIFLAKDKQGRNIALGQEISDEQATEWVRIALGCDANVPIRISSVQHWKASANTAEKYQQGRVFLAGDAAHTMPPTGGWGGNTGVADAHNLAWKLARVIKGCASPALLDSYDIERRAAAKMTVEQAYSIYAGRYIKRATSDTKPLAELRPAEDIELGYIYRSSAVKDAGCYTGDVPADTCSPRVKQVVLGARIPHYPVNYQGQVKSILDLCVDDQFTLLCAEQADRWQQVGEVLAQDQQLNLQTVQVGHHVQVETIGKFGEALGIGQHGAVLLRPDAVVGWVAKDHSAANEQTLKDVVRSLNGY